MPKKGNNVNKLTNNKNENEEEKNEVTGFAIVNGLYFKATSPDMLLLSFMSVTQDCMSVIPTLQAKYLRNLKIKRDEATPTPNTNERDGTDPSCPLPDPYKVISDNHKEQKVLEKLEKVLNTFYKQLLEAVQRGNVEQAQKFLEPIYIPTCSQDQGNREDLLSFQQKQDPTRQDLLDAGDGLDETGRQST